MSGVSSTPPGWYPDATGRVGAERYYDGAAWTDQTRTVAVSFPAPAANTFDHAAPASAPRVPAPATAGHHPAPRPGAFTPPAAPAATAPAAPTPGAHHGHLPSLLDGIAFGPSPDTAQGLLRGTGVDRLPRALQVSTRATPPGWYPDPARSGRLRFFDGKTWTARTRVPLDGRKKKLPRAAQELRARLLELADDQAVRTSGKPRKVRRIQVSAPSAAPSLNGGTRVRSGSVLGMLSMLMIVAGLSASAVIGWQLWGSNVYEQMHQGELTSELSQQAKEQGVDYSPFVGGDDPTPVALPTLPVDPPTSTPTKAAPKPAGGARPALNSHPADIAPFPPAGWTPPAGRTVPAMPKGDGKAVGRLIIPRMGVDRVFVLGTGVSELKKGPGLWKWGAFPGTPGNTTISGHRTTYGAPFYDMAKLRYGDQIIIEVPGQPRAVYEVRGRVIASPFDVQVTRQAPGVRLTLTTCHPIHSAAQRMVVEAELVEGAWLDKAVNRSQWKVLK